MMSNRAYRIQSQPPYFVGLEGAGTVAAVGQDLKKAHKVGDRVHVHHIGGLREFVLIDSEEVRAVAEDLSLKEAACHIVNPATVAYMASLAVRGGHKAAINTAASSALGRMFIRYCKERGVKTINTVRQDKYIEELKKEGADYVLNSQAADFESKLKEIAEKEGATISFEAVGGDLTRKILGNQPEDSICYIYGGLEGEKIKDLGVGDFIFQGKTVTGFWLGKYLRKNWNEFGEIQKELETHAKTIFKSHIQKVFKLTELEEALAYYKDNSTTPLIEPAYAMSD
ncbi:MAG: hypothetical protein EOP04_23445 [Proteobacteria bacterium]|nr:MAG: hypothetical protein EOP04_23445 [Pseudomonadota bacterium]